MENLRRKRFEAYIDIGNDVRLASILAKRSNRYTMTSIANDVGNVDVGRIRLEGNTVVVIIHPGVLDGHVR